MKAIPWQIFVVVGLMFVVIDLLIKLLLPIGIVLLIIGAILYAMSRSDAPKVIKK